MKFDLENLDEENLLKRILLGVLMGLFVFLILSILSIVLPPVILIMAILAPDKFKEQQEKLPLND